MNFEKIDEILSGEPEFRKKQVKKLVFRDLIDDWSQATVLPQELREKLSKKFPLKINAEIFEAKDGQSAKALIALEDGLKVETVLMRHGFNLPKSPLYKGSGKADKIRNSICVSSQVGCPLGCAFCATGRMGFKRNLDKWEIIEQVLMWARLLTLERSEGRHAHPRGGNIQNIVFMGMGEPFLNYENVLGAIKILNDKEGFNLGARHFSISTVGIAEGIKKLSEEPLQINLAISLHAPTNDLRSKIMPVNKKYPLEKTLKAVDDYVSKTNRRVMMEYIMIKGANDSDECARELAKLMKRPLVFVNLISYNPTGFFEPSARERIKKFKQILERENIVVTERFRFGSDIKAACGQLISDN